MGAEELAEVVYTFREGLLPAVIFGGAACLEGGSAGVTGDGSESWNTLTVASERFSWELEGSMASLLGTGVMLEDPFLFSWRELRLVFSLRQGDELAVGEGFFVVLLVAAALEEGAGVPF